MTRSAEWPLLEWDLRQSSQPVTVVIPAVDRRSRDMKGLLVTADNTQCTTVNATPGSTERMLAVWKLRPSSGARRVNMPTPG
jgi:hypothetical protein